MTNKQFALHGIHVFLSHHIDGYDKKWTIEIVVSFYKTIDPSSKRGDSFKIMYIHNHFKLFRDWFFDLDRERLHFEH